VRADEEPVQVGRAGEVGQEDVDHVSYNEALGATLIERGIREKIVLVGVTIPPARADETEAELDELELLVDTAGADVVARLEQRRERPDAATFVGRGKAEELRELCLAVDADTVVFANDLTPAQQYNLEKLLGRTAIERTAVILDIFAQNAHTLEGRAQVELALLQYRLPRLRRGAQGRLSQQGGGIGTRQGPGETKLETDRRRLTRRIARLQGDLADLQRNRQLQRRSRSRSGLANVTIVGYTNAGKSTLLNRLTTAGVLVEDRLFATLDPTTRRLALPGGEPVLLTDTVGFVRRLPHGLVEAFKSTLEVVAEADLLVHLVDASSVDPEAQIDAVHTVLGEIQAGDVPELLVFNKADLAPEEARRQVKLHPGSVAISATTGRGVNDLLNAVSDRLRAVAEVVELVVPYDRGDVLAALHREGEVLSTVHDDAGIRVRARLSRPSVGRLAEFVVRDVAPAPQPAGSRPR
jgi:GTPase